MPTKEAVLKKYFGYDAFRPLQAEIIDTILAKKDCLVLMPTGGGKSVCYQVPAMVMEGLAVVVSPLIALMRDQVQALHANGVPAAFLNSSMTNAEQVQLEQACRNQEIKILYVSPERVFSGGFMSFLKRLSINLFAIDESHCVSFWGHDFRPEYAQLHQLRKEFPEVPFVALTATADKVTRKDILTQLALNNAEIFISSFDRPNLSLTVLQGRKKIQAIESFLQRNPDQAGIIYCLSRKTTENVAEKLFNLGYNVKFYHAGLDNESRSRVQDAFIKDDVQIIVATVAFGMGIDKSNIRWVIHYNLPKNIESFYQEIGRAGRDGMPAKTILFYSYADVMAQQEMNSNSDLTPERKELQNAKLERMRQYAETDICRRRILLSYFNEPIEKDCGNCDVCKNPKVRFDGTILTQKALSAVARTNEKISLGMLIDILRGSFKKEITDRKYQELKTFGTGKDLKTEEWADYIWQMLNSGAMDIAYDEKHNFKLNATSWQILKENKPVMLSKFVSFQERQQNTIQEAPRETKTDVYQKEIFERLRTLRKKLADEKNIPAYAVFSDATLTQMADKKPISRTGMMDISGMGEQKFHQYGEIFINEILDFLKEKKSTVGSLKIDTSEISYQLYKEGFDLDTIANKRGLKTDTIFAHLIKYYEQGKDIDLKKYLEKHEYTEITKAAQKLGIEKATPLKPLFEHFEEKYPYFKLRVAVAIWARDKKY